MAEDAPIARRKTMRNLHNTFIIFVFTLFFFQCDDLSQSENECIKGRYIMPYCEGFAIEILDSKSEIGKDWIGIDGKTEFKNSVVASIDSSLYIPNSFFLNDSIFYFKYKNGGYAQKLYMVCEPAPFITINYISKNFCENTIIK